MAQSAVVGGGRDALVAQQVGQLFGALARADVDDAAAFDPPQQPEQLPVLVLGAADAVGEVGTCEAAAQDVGLGEVEVAHDVLGHERRGRGGERQHRHAGKLAAQLGDAQVGGAEVVAPLRDAVGLVDGQQRDLHPLDAQPEGVGREPLGGDVEELHVAVGAVVQRNVDLAGREARVDRHGRNVQRAQPVDLVLHQGDEGGDDDAEPLAGHRRDLVGERLAAAGGHQRERIAPLQHRADNLLLYGPEGVVAPVLLQDGMNVANFHTLQN